VTKIDIHKPKEKNFNMFHIFLIMAEIGIYIALESTYMI